MPPLHPLSVDRLIRECGSWTEFFREVSSLPNSARRGGVDKGNAFERLTQLYLQTHPEYLTKLRSVWRAEDELPAAIRARMGLPGTDEGIDLVAETFEGEFWAIQCKFRTATHRPLTVTELSTFTNLSFNICRGISLAVVAHTCSKPVRKRKLLGHATEIGMDRWLEIDEEDWKRIQTATTTPPPPPEPRKPRKHQQTAIAAAKRHFATNQASRGRLTMPCGTGKSLTAFWIAQELDLRSILVAVPSLSLIKQSLTDWTREFLAHGEIPEWLCVCSDEATGRLERDEFVGGVYDLGVDATTDAGEIARFLGKKTDRRRIVFTTYQSGKALADAGRQVGFAFDLGIMDEAHRTVGSPDKSFGHLLLDENIPITRRLFMTATERVVRGKDDDVLSMDDPNVYGECFHQLTFKQAIEAEPPIISDYKILTITVTDENLRQLVEENRYLRTSDEALGEREAQALAAGIALQRAYQEEGVRHAITFHRSIRGAKEFMAQHKRLVVDDKETERPACFHISSKKTTGERAELVREFRDSPVSLITNARCLQEGVDIPVVDCVLFADPKQSVVDIVQATGRAMRPHKGKQFGYVVVPIVVPSEMDFVDFAETTAFKQVARVITALSTQDDRIAEEFRAVAAKTQRAGRIVEIKGDIPVGYQIGLKEFQAQIDLRLWERVGRANWRPFEEARAFACSLQLSGQRQWYRYCYGQNTAPDTPLRLPDIPTNPQRTYANDGWAGWGDWLGTGNINPRFAQYRPFDEARDFARGLMFSSRSQWEQYCRGLLPEKGALPVDIPANPNVVYAKKGWRGVGDWLGTGVVATSKRRYRPFQEARVFVCGLRLKDESDWRRFCKGELPDKGKLPSDIPADPRRTYKAEWIGMWDWIDAGRRRGVWRGFSEARSFARGLGLGSWEEWKRFSKGLLLETERLPNDIPARPDTVYACRGPGVLSSL